MNIFLCGFIAESCEQPKILRFLFLIENWFTKPVHFVGVDI